MRTNIQDIEKQTASIVKHHFRVGDTVRVHYKIKEGDKERIQTFEGIVITDKNGGVRRTFKVRKISYGIGVERTFPIHSPRVEKVEVLSSGRVRRAKLYYLRGIKGSKATHLKTDNKKLLRTQQQLEALDKGAAEAQPETVEPAVAAPASGNAAAKKE
jgi:large subunit ribosomal protein L19